MTTSTPTKKLSALIREGVKRVNHCRWKNFHVTETGNVTQACALGIAWLAEKDIQSRYYRVQSSRELPMLGRLIRELHESTHIDLHTRIPVEQVPYAVASPRELQEVIVYLNDEMNWSIGHIVEWLESIGY